MAQSEHRSFEKSDEVRSFEHGRVELLHIGGSEVGRFTLEPGWRWSENVKPIVGTDWCEASHFAYQLSGRLHVQMKDGAEFEIGPGDVSALPPGHDAWVAGDEAVVTIDWTGASNYAQQ
jgi:quercetin dioxygenase-like cupin family protein